MARRKKAEEGKKGLDEWMGTYGDMVTLLLCFFILLFAMSNVDATKFKSMASSFSQDISIMPSTSSGMTEALGNGIIEMPEVKGNAEKKGHKGDEAKQELANMSSNFKSYFAKNNMSDKVDVDDSSDQYITLNFSEGILFDSGRAELKEGAVGILGMVADELLKYPENDIKIEGHTDNRPINTDRYPNNWYLSAARSISVAVYFTDTKNFDPARISTEGFGEYRPKVANDTPENRAINRRVEIKILSKQYSNDNMKFTN